MTRYPKLALAVVACMAALPACAAGGNQRAPRQARDRHHHAQSRGAPARHVSAPAAITPLQAIVTAPGEDRLLTVDVRSGRVRGAVSLPGEPEFIAPTPGLPYVVSLARGAVAVVAGNPTRRVKVFSGFASPPLAAIGDCGGYAYLTDGTTGKLTVVGLYNERVISSIRVGLGAHHLAFAPDARQVWIALGQAAHTIVILSTVVATPSAPGWGPVINGGRPHLVGRIDPGFLAHDLAFSPDGRRVWITSANTSYTGVFSADSHHLLFRVPAGPPPQHVAIAGAYAYITSGYGSRIEQVALSSGRVLKAARAPYGSFDLAAAGGYVVTVSLLRGTIAIYDSKLRLLRVEHLAPSIKDVMLARP